MQAPSARLERLLLGLTLALALLLRVREAIRTPLWFDELYSLSAVQRSLPETLEVMRRDVHPPLHFLLSWLWMRLDASDLWVRGFSIVMGSAGILAAWALGRALAGPRVGLLAAAILTLHPWHVYISQEARSYALLWCMLTVSAWAAWRLLEAPSRAGMLVYAIAAASALWSHYLAGVVLAVLGLWGLLVWGRDPARRLAWLRGNALALALFAPVAVLLSQQIERARADHWVPPPTAMELLDIGRRIASGSNLLALLLAALALLPLLTPFRRRAAGLLWAVGGGGVLACWLMGLAGYRMFAVKYVLFALPFAAVLFALGLEAIDRRPLRWVAVAVLLVGLARSAWLRPPHVEASSFGVVAEALEGRVRSGDVCFHGDTHAWFWGRHYLPQATHVLLMMGRTLPYFEGAALVPSTAMVEVDSLERTSRRGARWWGFTVHKAGLTGEPAAARFDARAVAPAETLGLVRVWWSDPAVGSRLLVARPRLP